MLRSVLISSKTWALAAVGSLLVLAAACTPARDLTVSESCSTFESLNTGSDQEVLVADIRAAEPRMDEVVARQVRQYVDAAEWADSHDVNHPRAFEHMKLMMDAGYRLDEICGFY